MKKQDKDAKKILKSDTKSKRNGWVTPLVLVCCIMFVLDLILFVGLFGIINPQEIKRENERVEIINSKTFHDGIKIAGVDVGGMTRAEALAALQPVEDSISSEIHFTLQYDGGTFELNRDNLNITFDTESVIDEAMNIGRNGGYLSLKNDINTYGKGVAYDISYTLDATPLFTALDPIIDEITVAPKNAEAVVDESVKISYSTVVNGFPFKVVDAVDGVTVDKDALYATLTERAQNKQFGEVEIPLLPLKAEVTAGNIRDNLICRAWFVTSYASGNSYNRVFNIQRASDRINGVVVKPGEQFSMNDTIGPRYASNGWLDAPAVISGGAATENQPGGGVCQVSTTLYSAVVKSDLKVVSRRNHSKRSTYVDGGLDATINTGTIDFIWENNTNSPVYVFSWLDKSAQKIYCAIFAEKFPDTFDRIEFYSEYVKAIEPTEVKTVVKSGLTNGQWMLYNKAITGHVYQSYAKYYKGNTLVETREIAKSTYNMHPKTYYVAADFNGNFDPAKEMVMDANGNFVPKYQGGTGVGDPNATDAPVTDGGQEVTDPNTTTAPDNNQQP